MIPRDDKIITLAIDIRSFKQISSSQWKDLEELYTLVYVERYAEDNSILFWETDDGRSITLPYYVDCRRTARQIMRESALRFGYDRQDMPGAGAAGGLGYAFLQFLNADCRSGIGLLLDAVRFEEQLTGASLVITGEGSADRQTLMGKLPFGILQRANDVPVALIAGRIKDHEPLLEAGFSQVLCINPPDLSLEEAMKPGTAKRNIARTMKKLI